MVVVFQSSEEQNCHTRVYGCPFLIVLWNPACAGFPLDSPLWEGCILLFMSKPDRLMRIGQFANATFLSIKALRLYDQMGILQPVHLDDDSGYRYYSPAQLPTARLIRTLRQMDMPLALVRELLEADSDTAVSLLTQYRQAYETRVLHVRRTTDELITQLQNEVKSMTLEVEVKECAAQQVASISTHVFAAQLDDTISSNLDRLAQFAREQNGSTVGAPFGIFHGPINETENGPVEICWSVNGSLTAVDDIVVKNLPQTKAATVSVYGEMCEFPHILKAYDAAVDWIQTNGYEIADSPREVWHSSPGPDAHMEIVWPFHKS